MSDSTSTTTSGIGFFGLLTIVLITLKLIGYLTWSWLWVLSPLLIPVIIFTFLVILFVLGIGIAQSRGQNPFR